MKILTGLDSGWHVGKFWDNVRVDYKAVAFKTPDLGAEGTVGKFRTTWAFLKQEHGGSKRCRSEKEVEWTEMKKPIVSFLKSQRTNLSQFFPIGKEGRNC